MSAILSELRLMLSVVGALQTVISLLRPHVLVIGGSQGAKALNEGLPKKLKEWLSLRNRSHSPNRSYSAKSSRSAISSVRP